MTIRPSRLAALLCASALASACADQVNEPTPGFEGPGVTVNVAPLNLGAVEEVCYGLTVFNGEPGAAGTDTVWTQPDVCSGQYGNGEGGGVSYVGPCDASVTAGGTNNFVQLVVNSIDAGGESLGAGDFVNPCPNPGDCVVDFACEENGDVFVEFNITVMRAARQGFFDIAVNFEDIYCSAKLDSCYGGQETEVAETHMYDPGDGSDPFLTYVYTNGQKQYYAAWFAYDPGPGGEWVLFTDDGTLGKVVTDDDTLLSSLNVGDTTYTLVTTTTLNGGTPITLLHGDSGREHTAVAALACTAGPDSAGTELVMTAPVVACSSVAAQAAVVFTLDLEGALQGNGSLTVNAGATGLETDFTLDYGLYYGQESLTCGVDGDGDPISCNKVYYNIALNIEALADQGLSNCAFLMAASAIEVGSDIVDANGDFADPNAVYPGIVYGNQGSATLTGAFDADVGPETLCFAHPLDGAGSAVATGYVKGSSYGQGGSFSADFHTDGGPAQAYAGPN